jgi:hypothetical protein
MNLGDSKLPNCDFISENASVFCGSLCASAPCYGRTEDVGVLPIVVAELKFRDVERHIFGADFVEASNDPALKERPKALNRVRVDRADDVFPRAVIHDAVLVSVLSQIVVRGFDRLRAG